MDKYIYIIIALLPLTSLMLVTQTNPYQALVIRAILGAIATLVYIVLGAGDVALTEALVGTMLGITLYVIAVRSSFVMSLGILEENLESKNPIESKHNNYFLELIANCRQIVNQYHLRLELIKYPNFQSLEQALIKKEVHAICTQQKQNEAEEININHNYHIAIRVPRLFEILQKELTLPETTLTYINVSNQENKN